MLEDNGKCLDWEDSINGDGRRRVILPEGEYDFTVVKVDRQIFVGSDKIPPCNRAILTLRIDMADDTAIFYTDLLLHKSREWQLCAFFQSIAKKQPGKAYTMNWNEVEGAIGHAKIGVKTYTDKNENERTVNIVERYFDWDPDRLPFG